MKLKKVIVLLLCAALIFTLVGCTGTDRDAIKGSISDKVQENIGGSVTPDDPEKTSEDPSESDSDENPDETSENTPNDSDLVELGNVSGSVYRNPSIGIACDLSANWIYANEDELAEMNELSAELFDDEELKEQLLNADMFYDFYAESTDGTANLQVLFENLGVLYGTILDEDGYIELSLDGLEAGLSSAGMSNIQSQKKNVNFAGKSRSAIYVTSQASGITVYQYMIPIKTGDYMAVVVVTCSLADITENLMDMFYAITN